MTFCREGLYYLCVVLFIIGGAVLRERNLLVLLAGILLGPLIVHWRLVGLMLGRLSVRRRLPDRICAGDPLTVEILAVNQRRRLTSWAVVVQDTIQRLGTRDADDRTRVEVLFPCIEAGQTRGASYRCDLTRRGRYRFGPLRVSTRFPLGLIQASFWARTEDTLVVCPRLGLLQRRWHQLFESQRRGSQNHHRRRGLVEGDYYGLREWQPGDSRRWIHWRTSAKLGELAVRQFEQQRGRDLALILDLWETDEAAGQRDEKVELAVSFAATVVADAAVRQSSYLMVALAGQESRFWKTAPASRVMTHEILEQLATLQAGREPHLPGLIRDVARNVSGGMRIVVISTRAAQWETLLRGAEPLNGTPADRPRDALWLDVGSEELASFYQLSPRSPSASNSPAAHSPGAPVPPPVPADSATPPGPLSPLGPSSPSGPLSPAGNASSPAGAASPAGAGSPAGTGPLSGAEPEVPSDAR